jgi:hypothetical protein
MTAALAVAVSLGGCGTGGHQAGPPRLVRTGQLRQSIARAYAFLDQMTDRYAAGSTPRLVQSFTGGTLGRQHRDPRFAASVSWDVQNLAVTGPFRGASFCRDDRSGVWFEGTAHLADALEFRGAPGDRAQAAQYLADIYYAQTHGPGADGRGIIAASRNGLTDCGGGSYYTSLHTGTTAWYIPSADKINPFALIPAAGHR